MSNILFMNVERDLIFYSYVDTDFIRDEDQKAASVVNNLSLAHNLS